MSKHCSVGQQKTKAVEPEQQALKNTEKAEVE